MTSSSTSSLRLFYALWPDDATRAALAGLQILANGRLTRYANLHITLAFLGEQPAALLPTLKDILEHCAALPMTLQIDRIGYFTHSRIVWAGMHQVPAPLLALRQSLAEQLNRHAVEFDNRLAFKPHVTLARDSDAPPDLSFETVTWRATHLALVQSRTGKEGVDYQVLASRQLGAAA
jgi:2'-5' RNA ligase